MRHLLLACLLTLALLQMPACSSEPEVQINAWQLVFDQDYLSKHVGIPGALLSVWGTSEHDVWMVGGPQEVTPTSPATILNWDGTSWHRLILPKVLGTFWWVTGVSGQSDVLWLAGKDGLAVRYDHTKSQFTRQLIPSTTQLWGMLALAENDVWAVGGEAAQCHDNLPCGVIWHYDGSTWTTPKDLPAGWATTAWF